MIEFKRKKVNDGDELPIDPGQVLETRPLTDAPEHASYQLEVWYYE